MRTLLLLLLLAVAAPAQDQDALRKFIDSFRSELEREQIELVLPKELPPPPPRAWLTANFWAGSQDPRYGVLWMDSLPGAHKDKVRVLRIRHGYGDNVDRLLGYGVSCEGAIVTRAQFDALERDLLRIRGASLIRVRGNPRHDGWMGTSDDGDMKLELLTGKGLSLLADTRAPTPGAGPNGELERFGPWERSGLYAARIRMALTAWKLKPRVVPDAASARLLRELEKLKMRGSGSFMPILLRVNVLGAIGYKPALPALKRFKGGPGPIADAARLARRRIEILGSAEPEKALVEALGDSDEGVRAWAGEAAQRVFPDAYRASLVRRFESGDDATRIAILEQLKPDDLALAQRALTDPSMGVRATGAVILWQAEQDPNALDAMFVILADAKSQSEKDVSNRRNMLYVLLAADLVSARDRIEVALIERVIDASEHRILRDEAVMALARIGGARSIAALREQFTTEEASNELRAGIAATLGALVASDAAPALIAYLGTEPVKGDEKLRWNVGRALGLIGAPEARAVLEKERDRAAPDDQIKWERALALIEVLNANDGGDALLADKRMFDWLSNEVRVRHLVRLCTEEQLQTLRGKYPQYREEIDAALARK